MWLGGALLGWIAGGMMVTDGFVVSRWPEAAEWHYAAGIVGALIVVAVGGWFARRAKLKKD